MNSRSKLAWGNLKKVVKETYRKKTNFRYMGNIKHSTSERFKQESGTGLFQNLLKALKETSKTLKGTKNGL
ncbi:hypothetical protein Y1Q_0010660 [Alligator mississippiensis]|uniref:Uncharacterized protein n=1 Tax=Alligator mississippiensis TaxID=8496 RepID=A0A151M6H2_ALLMI|nr:hypothetical protein Y1Q_0010660 [Alligator mississippiensis]